MSIASELNRLLQAKSDLATSITNKGVTVPASATLDDYPALVDSIQTGGGSHPLPQGAVEISYLQGDGDSYIDTGIKASSEICFRMEVYIMSSLPVLTSQTPLMGSRVGSIDSALTVQYYNTSSNKYFRWAFGNAATTVNHSGTKGGYVISNLDRPRFLVTTGAKQLTAEVANSTFSNNYNIYLLAYNNAGTVGGLAGNEYTRIINCKIWDSYELVRDYVPIRIGQVGYLFDKVSGQSFGNAGTGSFTLGPDVT